MAFPPTDEVRNADRGVVAVLAAIVLAAFAVRTYGVNLGLPFLYYWDEPTVVNRAVRFGSGDLNPHFFYYPALYMYVLFGACGLYYVGGRLLGQFTSSQDFAVDYFVRPSGVYTCARITTAIIGTLSVLLVYQVGRRFFGKAVGVIAAAVLAVSVLHASYSHVAITDVPQTFFILAAYVPIHSVIVRSRPRDYALAGALIGLGVATKYLPALMVPTLLLAHVLRDERATAPVPLGARIMRDALDPRLLWAFAALGAAFFVTSPFNVLDFRAFIADYRAQVALSRGGTEAHPALFFLRVLTLDFGWPLCVAAGVGVVTMLPALAVPAGRSSRTNVVFLSFPLVYFLATSGITKPFARYMIPEDPFVAIAAAVGFVALAERASAKLRTTTLGAAVAVACAIPATRLVRWDARMAHGVDTRTEAVKWAESTLLEGTSVAIEPLYERTFFNAPLLTDAAIAKVSRDLSSAGRLGAVRERVVTGLRRRPVYTLAPWAGNLDELEREGARYVFISDLCGPVEEPLASALQSRATVARVFAPEETGFGDVPSWPDIVPVIAPRITVYELQAPGTEPSASTGI
jgi:hypothetical protein